MEIDGDLRSLDQEELPFYAQLTLRRPGKLFREPGGAYLRLFKSLLRSVRGRLGGEVVGSLASGELVESIGLKGLWLRVSRPGRPCWLHAYGESHLCDIARWDFRPWEPKNGPFSIVFVSPKALREGSEARHGLGTGPRSCAEGALLRGTSDPRARGA